MQRDRHGAAEETVNVEWKPRIVWALTRNDDLRFSELRRACPPISDRILSKELKALQAWGLIARKEYPVVPPHTEYRLTVLGRTLEPVMAAMADWGLKRRAQVMSIAEEAAEESDAPERPR
ncbi:MAG TPA: helix-turn-helix domain-containing protein [Roseiarcus sp.]